ncbi:hypothetical protein M0P98_08795 [bacterium]|nr:hypothetical protein [bacterium]
MKNKLYLIIILLAPIFLHSADYSSVLKRNIFAPMKEKESEQPTTTPKEVLPITKLPNLNDLIELKGTFYHTNSPKESIVILEDKKTKESTFYKIGDIINSALITDIQDQKIIVEYGFREMEVSLKGCSPTQIYTDNQYNINIDEFLQELQKEISDGSTIRGTSIKENGEVIGFTLTNIPENSILNRYGIKNNDIITKVNTIPLNSTEKPLFVYENIMKYGIKQVYIRLLRDNLPYTLLYRLQ